MQLIETWTILFVAELLVTVALQPFSSFFLLCPYDTVNSTAYIKTMLIIGIAT